MEHESPAEYADFRAVIDEIDEVVIWIANHPGEFHFVSAGAEDIWGIPATEIEADARLMIEGIHPDDRERVVSFIEQPAEKVTEASYENRVVQPDGTVRWVNTRQIPIRDDDGTLSHVVGICTDITEQKRREIEFAALNRIIRHDIRNDMAILLGWGELLREHLNEGGEEPLEKMLSAATDIIELTEISRDFAETVATEGQIDVKPVSLNSIFEAELDLRRELFPKAEFKLVDEIPEVNVMADEMLSSVFKNLLNNAVQHNDKDTPIVTITAEELDSSIIVSIADNGPGIPTEVKDRLFEEGIQGPDSMGTGLGLYLSKKLVTQYDGDIWVTENSPTGTVFHLQLPVSSSATSR